MPGVEIGVIFFSLAIILVLDHGWANIFCEGPYSEYFQLYQPYSLHAITQLCHGSAKATTVSMSKKGHGYELIKPFFFLSKNRWQSVFDQ